MDRARRWLLMALVLAQAGCAGQARHPAATQEVETNWACRRLDTSRQDSTSGGSNSGPFAVAGVLVAWSVLTATCLVSRS